MRKYPKPGSDPAASVADGEKELSDNMFGNQETTTVDYYQGGSSGGGRPTPILEPETASFFIVRAATYRDCSISTVRGEWFVQRKHAEKINKAFDSGKKVLIFFTVSDSNHIQGAALLTSTASYAEYADHPHATTVKAAAYDDGPFCYRFQCEWFRTCELPMSTALHAAPDLLLPTSSTQYCQDMTSKTGEAVMKAVWNSPLCTLYESWSGGDYDEETGNANSRPPPPVGDAILTDFRCPLPKEVAWPTMPGPGFIFGCNSQTMDECLGRGLFGLPAHMKVSLVYLQNPNP